MKQEPFNILFLGGGRRVGLAERFINAGKKLNINIQIFSYDIELDQPISSIGKVIRGLRWNDKKINEDLINILSLYSINLVIPTVDAALLIQGALKDNFLSLSLISDLETIMICNSKIRFQQICESKKIGVIPLWDKKTYPFFIKPNQGNASEGAQIILCSEQLNQVQKDSVNYIKQKYICGEEYSVDCYVSQKNQISAISPRIRERTAGGELIVTRTINDEKLKKQTRNIIKKLNLKGPLCIQFILDKNTNKFFLMEINPRLGGGVIASIEAGYDICEMMIREILMKKIPIIHKGIELRMKRYFSESFNEYNY